MIKTTAMLCDELKDYINPNAKIKRMVNDHLLFPVTRGIYETVSAIPGQYLANIIYGPSYLSFEYALSYHNLIPEAVYNYTCACFEKKKAKCYTTHFGTYTYHDIPSKPYPHYVNLINENGYSYMIAEPEKAICDMLYLSVPLHNRKNLISYLFEDLRIDIDAFNSLNREILSELCSLYSTTNHKLMHALIKKQNGE